MKFTIMDMQGYSIIPALHYTCYELRGKARDSYSLHTTSVQCNVSMKLLLLGLLKSKP